MRDPKRIQPILADLETFWSQHPDLRFWQVVEIVRARMSDCPDFDPFYVSDEKTLEVLERMNQNV